MDSPLSPDSHSLGIDANSSTHIQPARSGLHLPAHLDQPPPQVGGHSDSAATSPAARTIQKRAIECATNAACALPGIVLGAIITGASAAALTGAAIFSPLVAGGYAVKYFNQGSKLADSLKKGAIQAASVCGQLSAGVVLGGTVLAAGVAFPYQNTIFTKGKDFANKLFEGFASVGESIFKSSSTTKVAERAAKQADDHGTGILMDERNASVSETPADTSAAKSLHALKKENIPPFSGEKGKVRSNDTFEDYKKEFNNISESLNYRINRIPNYAEDYKIAPLRATAGGLNLAAETLDQMELEIKKSGAPQGSVEIYNKLVESYNQLVKDFRALEGKS